jgi:hypothetical protein
MGIRVHKVMGYGLTDVKCDKYNIADPRVNPEGIFCDYETEFKVEDFMAFLKKEAKRKDIDTWHASFEFAFLRDLKKMKSSLDPKRCFVYDGEYGLNNVLLVVPLSRKHEWFRYDNAIDYAEESNRGRVEKNYQCINHVREIPEGFHPWENQYWDKRTFKKIPWEIMEHRYNEKFFEDAALDIVARSHGSDTWKEMKENMTPVVPECVRLLCEWGQAFTDPSVWTQLRPMIYVYWS